MPSAPADPRLFPRIQGFVEDSLRIAEVDRDIAVDPVDLIFRKPLDKIFTDVLIDKGDKYDSV